MGFLQKSCVLTQIQGKNFSYFRHILRLEFAKTIFLFEIDTLKIIQIESFIKKKKNFKFGTKNTLFRYFWAAILKKYNHIWTQHSPFFQNVKFHPKQTNKKKMRPKISFLGIFELEFGKTIVILHVNTFQFFKKCKALCKI